MRKLFIVFALLVIPVMATAAPFLVCDPQAGITTYKLTVTNGGVQLAWALPGTVAAQSDGSLRLDIANAPVGTNSLTVAACSIDETWGEVCSAAIPFSFTRPQLTAPSIPVGLRLAK